MKPDEVTTQNGVPVTTPVRTLLDLASVVDHRDLERALAQSKRQGQVSSGQLRAVLARYRRRPGTPRLRALLEEEAEPALTRSEAEHRFLALVRRAQLTAPESNVSIGDREVDFYWRRERLVVEVDGFAFHSSLEKFESDRRRDARLTAMGLRVMRVTWRQVVREPEAVLVRLAQALALARNG